MTPRDLSAMEVGQCKYVLVTDADGGIVNDPVLLRLGEERFWFSLADSDVLLWAQGVAVSSGLDVILREPDVSPLQLQGPKSREIMCELFGDGISDLRYFRLRELELAGIPLVVSRTGWSSEVGYELYLQDGSRGDETTSRAPVVSRYPARAPSAIAKRRLRHDIPPSSFAASLFSTSRTR